MLTMMLVIMGILLALGFPMMVPILAGPLIGFFFYDINVDKMFIVQQLIGGVKPVAIIAVPLYVFAADLVIAGESAKRLLDFVMAFVGNIRGGLAISCAWGCTLFGAVSGSCQATVVAIGGVLRPRMLEVGYSSPFATGLIISSADIALLIPPSVVMIIYGVVTGTSIGEMYIAGIGPGVLIAVLFSIYSYFHARVTKVPTQPKTSWRMKAKFLRRASLCFGYPVIIIGGVYSGTFSPTEAAAFAILWAVIVEMIIFRAIKIRDIFRVALSTAIVSAVILILVGAGVAFSWVLAFAKIPQTIVTSLMGPNPSPLKILFIINLVYFVGCMFVDGLVVVLICAPILHPAAVSAGIDPVLVGVLVTLQLAIGSCTPPFGCDIFTAIAIFRRPYWEVVKGTPIFTAILCLVAALMCLFPPITLFLRNMAFR